MRAARLGLLLRVRARTEERAAAALGAPLAALRACEAQVARLAAQARDQVPGAVAIARDGGTAVRASDLQSSAAYGRRLHAALQAEAQGVAASRRAVEAARAAHGRAHADREAVERLVEAERRERRRARDAVTDEELLDTARLPPRRRAAAAGSSG